MLFVNFLCLFYLMVLVTSHTISKSIAKTKSLDETYDTFNDSGFKKQQNLKHRTHSYRRERCYGKPGAEKDDYEKTDKCKICKSKAEVHGKGNGKLHRLFSKFNHKKEKEKIADSDILIEQWPLINFSKVPDAIHKSSIYNTVVNMASKFSKTGKQTTTRKRGKRKRIKASYKKDSMPVQDSIEKPPVKFKRSSQTDKTRRTSTARHTQRYDMNNNNITQILSAMSTKLEELKRLYSALDYTTVVTPNIEKISTHNEDNKVTNEEQNISNTLAQNVNDHYDGTASLEAMLNEVKYKAIEMIASQTPMVTELISNAVTETTHAMDPLLQHTNEPPLFVLTTLMTMDEELADKVTGKAMRQLETSNDNSSYFMFRTDPTRKVRSLTDGSYTLAASWHEFNSKFHNSLRNIYHKVKGDVQKQAATTKKAIAKTTKSITKKIKTCPKQKTKEKVCTKPKLIQNNNMSNLTDKNLYPHIDYGKKTRSSEKWKTTTTTAAMTRFEDDDYSMLSLYEHMLSKAHETNLMKYLFTKMHPTVKRSMRNAKGNLKSEVKKNSYDYHISVSTKIDDMDTSTSSYDETSYEGLSKKLSYNDFVNGYKHYLNFERDMGHTNYSNMVRYQAHRHHSVDDIGKYILDKIPQIPTTDRYDRYKRDFFDYYDDDQDVSTKSEDSWFKKHFHYFVDRSGTPKKYHTAQTIALKPPLEAKDNNVYLPERGEFVENNEDFQTKAPDLYLESPDKTMGLDQLSVLLNVLETSTTMISSKEAKRHGDGDNLLLFKNALHSPHLIDKFLSGIGRAGKTSIPKGEVSKSSAGEMNEDTETRSKRRYDFDVMKENKSHKKRNAINHTFVQLNDDKKKVGYATVTIVTASADQKKKGILKTWLKKLKLHKKKRRTKRESERRARFDFIKKLKHLFGSSTHLDDAAEVDYDVATTKLKAFKPISFNTAPSLDEIRQELPNVPDDERDTTTMNFDDTQNLLTRNETPDHWRYYKLKLKSKPKNPGKLYESNGLDQIQEIKHQIEQIDNRITTQVSDKIPSEPVSTTLMYNFPERLNQLKTDQHQVASRTNVIILTPVAKTENKFKFEPPAATKKTTPFKVEKLPLYKLNNDDYYNQETQIDSPVSQVVDYSENQYKWANRGGTRLTKKAFNVKAKPNSAVGTAEISNNLTEAFTSADDFSDLVMWYSDILNSNSTMDCILRNMVTESETNMSTDRDMKAEFSDFETHSMKNKPTTLTRKIEGSGVMKNELSTLASRVGFVEILKNDLPALPLREDDEKLRNVVHKVKGMHKRRGERTSKDFVRKLHRLLTKTPDDTQKNLESRKNNKDIAESGGLSTLLVDSTMFAYDDDIDFFTENVRKIAKNSLPYTAKGKNVTSSIKITPPHQYHTTPLPLSTEDFNTFLKENNLDLDTVTTDLPDIYTIAKDLLGDKNRKGTPKSRNSKLKGNKHRINYNRKYANDASKGNAKGNEGEDGNEVKDGVNTPVSEYYENSNIVGDDGVSSLSELNAVTPNIKKVSMQSKGFKLTPKPPEDIEVTLINFNDDNGKIDTDLDMAYYNYPIADKNYTRKEDSLAYRHNTESRPEKENQRSKTVTKGLAAAKTKNTLKFYQYFTSSRGWANFLHNQLLYNEAYNQPSTSSTTKRTSTRIHSTTIEETQGTSEMAATKRKTTTKESTPKRTIQETAHDGLSRIKQMQRQRNPPKRIQIKSHSFKCSVVYEDDSNRNTMEAAKLEEPFLRIDRVYNQRVSKDPTKNRDKAWSKNKDEVDIIAVVEKDVNANEVFRRDDRLVAPVTASELVEVPCKEIRRAASVNDRRRLIGERYNKFHGNRNRKKIRGKRFNWFFPCSRFRKIKNSTKVTEKSTTSGMTSVTTVLNTKTKERKPEQTEGRITTTERHEETTEPILTKSTTKAASQASSNFFGKLMRAFTKSAKASEDQVYVEPLDDYPLSATDVIVESLDDYKMYSGVSKTPPKHTRKPKLVKRESEVHTAKDVAALEVIVDMVKHPLSEGRAQAHPISDVASPEKSPDSFVTNAIQVLISMPQISENSRNGKRSERIRKVFSAKMNTPVDLVYQIHSFEDETPPTATVITTTETIEDVIPSMYLIVESPNASIPRGNFMLKPIANKLPLQSLKSRTVQDIKEFAQTEKVSTPTPTNKLSKVTLSKDFISAVNKHLIQLYDSLYANETGRKMYVREHNKKVVRRAIDWQRIKKYFENERVCNCKCLANKTMCPACAASDAVMNELIFEINNIVKYIDDHCTEIQTYFWMNPSGGRKLRDAVKKIDTSLTAYYKRSKGKCKGKPCNAYKFIDKRQTVDYSNVLRSEIEKNLVDYIESLVRDINNAADLRICLDDLKLKYSKLIDVVSKCTDQNRVKRSALEEVRKTKHHSPKSVYSVDNVNVNIICNTDSTIATNQIPSESDILDHRLLDYGVDEVAEDARTRWNLKKYFNRKYDKALSIYSDKKRAGKVKFKKRDLGSIENPLNADTGGAFWSDYIAKVQTEQPQLIREMSEQIASRVTNDMNNNSTSDNNEKRLTPLENVAITHNATENNEFTNAINLHVKTEDIATTENISESLDHNINDLFKLLRNAYVVDMNDTVYLADASRDTDSEHATSTIRQHHHKKTKKKKKNKCKSKCKCKGQCTCNNKTTLNTNATSSVKVKSSDVITPVTIDNYTTSQSNIHKKTGNASRFAKSDWITEGDTIFHSTLDNNRNASVEFISSQSKHLTEETTKSKEHQKQIERLLQIFGVKRSASSTQINKDSETGSVLVESQPTTSYPTILIISEDNNAHNGGEGTWKSITNAFDDVGTNPMTVEPKEDYKGLRKSILKYKSKLLNREWQKLEGDRERGARLTAQEDEDMMGNEENDVSLLTVQILNRTQLKKKKEEGITFPDYKDCGILKRLKSLELPPPENIEDAGFLNRLLSKFVAKTKDPSQETKTGKTIENARKFSTVILKPISVDKTDENLKRDTGAFLNEADGESQDLADSTKMRKTCERPRSLCDIRATLAHILDSSRHMEKPQFHRFVKNITCFKYNEAPEYFYIDPKYKDDNKASSKSRRKRSDWIRSKRLISERNDFQSKTNLIELDGHYDGLWDTPHNFKNNGKEMTEVKAYHSDDDVKEKLGDNDERKVKENKVYVLRDNSDGFEKMYRDKRGIYRYVEMRREKRNVDDLEALSRKMRNLPPIRVPKNEIYAVLGDSITIPCSDSEAAGYSWQMDRGSFQNNVAVEGSHLAIKRVTAKNSGNYSCMKDNSLVNSMKLHVVAVPMFDIIFHPTYKSIRPCAQHKLEAVRRVGEMMREAGCPDGKCSVKIDQTFCSRDLAGNSSLISMKATMRSHRRGVRCSVECRRDLQSGLALLNANNARVLSSISVIIPRHGENVTLSPTRSRGRRMLATRTLNKDIDWNSNQADNVRNPEDLDVAMSCPAGFFLVSSLKICVADPPAETLEPKRLKRLPRYDWWRWSCVVVVPCVVGSAVCAGGNALAARLSERRAASVRAQVALHAVSEPPRTGARARRRISPSRVILPRLFRHASSKISEETKDTVKKKHTPPPLPRIDFDS